MMKRLRALTGVFSPAEWLIAALWGLVLLIVLAMTWSVLHVRRDAAKSDLAAAMAGADALSAGQAGAILDGAHAAAQQSEAQSRETANVIASAPGADQRLDPDLNQLGRRRLCERAAYRGAAECLQQPDRR